MSGMNRLTILALLLALALVGMADSWYLAESAATGTDLVCGIDGLSGCNTVAQSPYSRLFGIPLGIYGVMFYALMLVLASAALTLKLKDTPLYLLIVSGIGAAASVVFLCIQFFIIQALCIYCLVSALVAFASCTLSWLLVKYKEPTPLPV